MRILHVSIASFYTEGMTYQDNMLAEQNVLDGFEVIVISNGAKYKDGCIVRTGKQDIILRNGIRLIRLPYPVILGGLIGDKIKYFPDLFITIDSLNPDIILFHSIGGVSLLAGVKYKKKHPKVKFYVDNHAAFNNSAQTFISRNILHKLLYKPIIHYAYHYIERLFYISYETKDFLTELYKLPEEKLEFLPLGGTIIEGVERDEKRKRKRTELGLSDTDILLCHSGKLDSSKRTSDVLDALYSVRNDKFKLIITGFIPDYMKNELTSKIERDKRVEYLGWKSGDELLEYLCASDLYCQPGSQSATMQNAICCGAPVMLYPHKSHPPYLQGNGWFVESVADMASVFEEILAEPTKLQDMSQNSFKIAHELLDYKKLAARLYK